LTAINILCYVVRSDPDDDQERAMPTADTSEIRMPATDAEGMGHWQEPQTSHARLGARTLAGLVETSGRFRSISGTLVVNGALAAGAQPAQEFRS
jgi:hypothetical protein